MKHAYLFLTLVLLFALPARAQRSGGLTTQAAGAGPGGPPVTTYSCLERPSAAQLRADSMLSALDRTGLPSSVFYDRVPAHAWLQVFNRRYANPDTSTYAHWMRAYYEVRAADYTNNSAQPCRQLLADNAAHYRKAGTVLLGTLRYRLSYLDSNAVHDNLLYWDTSTQPKRLRDVPGRARSPYLLREAVVAAALAEQVSTGTVQFRLDPASCFTNTGAALSSALIDFGDGTATRTLTPGQAVGIGYTTPSRV